MMKTKFRMQQFNWPGLLLTMLVGWSLVGCDRQVSTPEDVPVTEASVASPSTASIEIPHNPNKNAYFGDTHIHTVLSFDAYIMGTRRTPDDAYAFAKGAAIEHASGFAMQMSKPLDFLAVSDHAFYLGMMRELGNPEGRFKDHRYAEVVRNAQDAASSTAAFQAVLGHAVHVRDSGEDDLDHPDVQRSAWQEVIEAAQRHNDPGRFTTFIGYEYTTSGPEFENLHRNVIFASDKVPDAPFSRLDSANPEDLWGWMDENRNNNMYAIAIPHNPNGSNGWMFERTYFMSDKPMDAAYAELRMRNEPIVENAQVKGVSDTHPFLSPNDEWADFDIMPIRVASLLLSKPQGSYVREAYLNGLLMEQESGFNPYKFGVIGASDTHNAAGSFEEDNYWSKTGYMDSEPHLRGSVPLPGSDPEQPEYANAAAQYWGPSGLAGVWAEANTRESIFAAMRRKETFSTSGPHIKVRFFAGYGLAAAMTDTDDPIAAAYAQGVPMGADLDTQASGTPEFYVWASRDPDTHALQRVQIIKGWIDEGQMHEKVIDVACSDGLAPDPETQRCPDNGAKVDITTCATSVDVGDAEISALWRDPQFNPAQRAFYYVRVLENPSCRWSTWDAVRAGVTPNPGMHTTQQDRAWSSPIWMMP